MTPESERKYSILELAVAELGIRKGATVVEFVGWWALTMHKHGDMWAFMGTTQRVEAFCDVSLYSLSQAWRYVRRFRQVFPNEVDPTQVVERAHIEASTKKQARDVRRVGFATP